MQYTCKFCNGRGTQASGLICISCRGRGSFDITEKTTSCSSCKGTGRATIKTLACISCGGKGFVILPEPEGSFKEDEEKAPPLPKQKTRAITTIVEKEKITPKRKVIKKVAEQPRFKQEFGEEHLDDLKKKLTDILEAS